MLFVEFFCVLWMFFCYLILLRPFFLYIYAIMRIQNKKIFASILFVLISFVCVAQGGDPPPPMPPPPPGLPIDGFTTIAVILGAAFGIKKTINNSKH